MLHPKPTYQISRLGMFPFIALVVLLVLIWGTAGAQITPAGAIEIEQGGQLWIEGSASVVNYTCRVEQLSGNGRIENTHHPQQNIKGHDAVSIQVNIPVKSFKCGKRAMNKDMYEALKAEDYPEIRYTLLAASLTDSSADKSDFWMDIKTTGVLEIAGVKDTTQVNVKGRLISGDRFRVKGNKQISMKIYNIKPPSAMFGIIKASTELTVHFDVTVQLKDTSFVSGISTSNINLRMIK